MNTKGFLIWKQYGLGGNGTALLKICGMRVLVCSVKQIGLLLLIWYLLHHTPIDLQMCCTCISSNDPMVRGI